MPEISVFDTTLERRRRARIAKNFQDHNFLHEWTNKRLIERLEDVRREFDMALHLGTVIPEFADKIKNKFHMDITGGDVIGFGEWLPFKDQSLDLITSTMALHTINDLPGALIQIRRALKPDGLFVAVMPGGETLYELRESLMQTEMAMKGGVSPRVYPFADKPQMGALLQRAGFALPVVDSEYVVVTYDNLFKLTADLRGMGQGNIIAARNRAYAGKNFFLQAAQEYAQRFAEPDGRIPATFEMIFLIGWAPHESQQKPLRPGSATKRLAEALGSSEQKI